MDVPEPSRNPCVPSPCGPNAQCQVTSGGSHSCSCNTGFLGSPPNCRPECVNNDECNLSLSCINQKCRDPCPGSCGTNAECRVVNHIPSCTCLDGYNGDPFVECNQKQRKFDNNKTDCMGNLNVYKIIINLKFPVAPQQPCIPSPCGINAVCKEYNGAGSCSCLSDYIGNPYEGCRPECITDSDCASNLACIRSKCQNPCPGRCGFNAVCQVVNHSPLCTCIPGFTGNPYVQCNFDRQAEREYREAELQTASYAIFI